MFQAKIIQNAVYVPELDTYFKSSHVHDYKSVKLDEGRVEVAIDGGRDYFRTTGDYEVLVASGRVFPWGLTSDSPISHIRRKLLWGILDRDTNRHDCRPISTLGVDHLQAILDTQILDPLYKEVVTYWLHFKKALRNPTVTAATLLPPKPKKPAAKRKKPSKR